MYLLVTEIIVTDCNMMVTVSFCAQNRLELELWTIIGGSVLIICLLISLGFHCLSQVKIRRQWTESLQIKNGLVVSIAIGKYDDPPRNAEVQGQFANLPVESDVENLKKMARALNFEFLNVPKSFGNLSWTKEKIFKFLREDVAEACLDKKGIPKFDGIIVGISGHGMRDGIISSKNEKINRTDIHRCISDNYPQIREIPRIFLFDACNGTRDRQHVVPAQSMSVDEADKSGMTSNIVVLSSLHSY